MVKTLIRNCWQEKIVVSVEITNGNKYEGIIMDFDSYGIAISTNGGKLIGINYTYILAIETRSIDNVLNIEVYRPSSDYFD